MNSFEVLLRRRQSLLAELSTLGPMRKGSLCEQVVQVELKDGSLRSRGPYLIYTYKDQGRTVSRRLNQPGQIELFRRQIDAFRRYQDLSAELVEISQRMADLEAEGDAEPKKKSKR